MLNSVGEAETLLASPDGAADPPKIAPRQQILDLAATLARSFLWKNCQMA